MAWHEAGAGRPAILIGPYPTDGRIWRHQLDAAEQGTLAARVIAIDLPGFGGSSPPDPMPDTFPFEELVTTVVQFLGRLDVVHPVVAGVGIGGTIAAGLAHAVEASAVLVIANKPGTDPPERQEARERTARDVVERGSGALAEELAAAALAVGAPADVRRKVASLIADADPRAIAALGRLIARRPDIVELLVRVDAPILVAGGAADRLSPAASVEALAHAVPGARLQMIPGSGHMVPLEAPDATTALLDRALGLAGG